MFKRIFSAMFLSITVLSGIFVEAIEYEIQDIGILQTHSSEAITINNQGQILGWYIIDKSDTVKHFFVRDKDGTFHEMPTKDPTSNHQINWRYLTDDGKAYGTFDVNTAMMALCSWDQKGGLTKYGALPGKEISAINNAGQVLITSIDENENEKIIRRPVIWHNGIITKLNGLEGNLGIPSDHASGCSMNNRGDVVGNSAIYLSYKNNIYKQFHATKWLYEKMLDPVLINSEKSLASCASLINDQGEVYVKSTEQSYFIDKKNNIMRVANDFTKINLNYLYNENYVLDIINKQWFTSVHNLNINVMRDLGSIWLKIVRFICINDNGEIVAEGETIYGEKHAMLLTPVKSN